MFMENSNRGMATKDGTIKTAHTVFKLLEELESANGMRLTELANRTDMATSTVHTHLKTLEQLDYVVKEGKRFTISYRFLEMGANKRKQSHLYEVAKPEIDKLAEQTGEHANLLVEEHGMGVFLYKQVGGEGVRDDTYLGKRTHLHTTALGKSHLAFMEPTQVDEILQTHGLPMITENTITEESALREELETIRNRGYAIDDEERIKRMRCVGVPVLGGDGTPVGAISVSASKKRMMGDRFEREIPQRLQGVANAIEVNLEHE
jgi:DNA-binding IclR family transcriptional regulator